MSLSPSSARRPRPHPTIVQVGSGQHPFGTYEDEPFPRMPSVSVRSAFSTRSGTHSVRRLSIFAVSEGECRQIAIADDTAILMEIYDQDDLFGLLFGRRVSLGVTYFLRLGAVKFVTTSIIALFYVFFCVYVCDSAHWMRQHHTVRTLFTAVCVAAALAKVVFFLRFNPFVMAKLLVRYDILFALLQSARFMTAITLLYARLDTNLVLGFFCTLSGIWINICIDAMRSRTRLRRSTALLWCVGWCYCTCLLVMMGCNWTVVSDARIVDLRNVMPAWLPVQWTPLDLHSTATDSMALITLIVTKNLLLLLYDPYGCVSLSAPYRRQRTGSPSTPRLSGLPSPEPDHTTQLPV